MEFATGEQVVVIKKDSMYYGYVGVVIGTGDRGVWVEVRTNPVNRKANRVVLYQADDLKQHRS